MAGMADDDDLPWRDRLNDVSDRLLMIVDEVRDLERRKRSMPVGSPEFEDLADAIVARSRDVFRASIEERNIGDEHSSVDGIEGDPAR
ncbi:MAG: hypothetical protein QOF49_313 [Chloroflexota bacterium]|nr:hypothetical protein [Chloroflexota bacterium]